MWSLPLSPNPFQNERVDVQRRWEPRDSTFLVERVLGLARTPPKDNEILDISDAQRVSNLCSIIYWKAYLRRQGRVIATAAAK